MRYFILTLLVVLASMVSAQELPVAEAYVYGNDLGTVTINDLSTDGRIITLKGVQVWPELTEQPKAVVVATDAQIRKAGLIDQVIDKQIGLQNLGVSKAEITPQLVAMMNADRQFVKAFQMSDSSFGYLWADEPDTQVFLVVDTENRVTKREILESQLSILKMYIEKGCIIIVTSSVRQAIPPSPIDPQQQAKARLEISAAKECSWNGGMLHEDVVRSFERPMTIPNPREE